MVRPSQFEIRSELEADSVRIAVVGELGAEGHLPFVEDTRLP
jgi:hypothetical protein